MLPESTVLPPSEVDWTITHWRDPPTEEGTLYAQCIFVDPDEIYSHRSPEDCPGYSSVSALNDLLTEMDLDITAERSPQELQELKETINEVASRQTGEAGNARVTEIGWADAWCSLDVTVGDRPPPLAEISRPRPSQASIDRTARALSRVLDRRIQKQHQGRSEGGSRR
jgi:hypothetical protein